MNNTTQEAWEEEQIEFDYVLNEIEVGVDICEGNYEILRYYRDEYKDLLAEVKQLREENHVLRMVDWEYERVWEWLMENADHTCRKLLLLIEEWKEEDGLVTIGEQMSNLGCESVSDLIAEVKRLKHELSDLIAEVEKEMVE